MHINKFEKKIRFIILKTYLKIKNETIFNYHSIDFNYFSSIYQLSTVRFIFLNRNLEKLFLF